MKHLLLLLTLAYGCGDNLAPEPQPDAGEVAPDAEEIPVCCTLLPDQDAVRACVAKDVPKGTCGVIACPIAGGHHERINFCGSMEP